MQHIWERGNTPNIERVLIYWWEDKATEKNIGKDFKQAICPLENEMINKPIKRFMSFRHQVNANQKKNEILFLLTGVTKIYNIGLRRCVDLCTLIYCHNLYEE